MARLTNDPSRLWGEIEAIIRRDQLRRALPFVAALVYLWLGMFVRLRAIGTNVGDDALYVREGLTILGGQWLGKAYDGLTLIKGPGYPLYMALNNRIGFSLLFSE